MSDSPIKRQDLNDQVYDLLLKWIVTGKLKPNERFSLNQLSGDLNVSRTPVHHALTRLVSENLVSVVPQQGYYVIPLTVKGVHDAYDVRLALELIAAERTIGRLSDDELSQLRHLMARTLSVISDNRFSDLRDYTIANRRFHFYQVQLADNEPMFRCYRRLKVNLFMERILQDQDVPVETIAAEHVGLVEAFEACDLARAQQVIRSHVETGKRLALEAIEAKGGPV